MFNNRYSDYYLVDVNDMDETQFLGEKTKAKCCTRKRKIMIVTAIFLILFLLLFVVFVLFPLVFMNNISLQRMLVFTRFNLQTNKEFYDKFYLPGYQNKYVTVRDLHGVSNKSIGLWHILPIELAAKAIKDKQYDYDDALQNTNHSVILYFHGTGEARSSSTRKYQFLRFFFHVITFDYRDYADSSKGELNEIEIVNDCIQVYEWLQNRTQAPIFVWGQSLGAAIALHTVAALNQQEIVPKGLILESAFTSLKDELYVHPYGKLFSWLPWFYHMVIEPLQQNGFVFNNAKNISNVNCPIMLLHAKDDSVVPYRMSEELYKIANSREVFGNSIRNNTVLHLFSKNLEYNHYSLYNDPFMPFYVKDFVDLCNNQPDNMTDVGRNEL